LTATAEIPTVSGHWLTGSAPDLRRAQHRFAAEIAHQHGGLARFRILNRSFIACASAEAIRHVMVERHENYPRSYHRRNGALVLGSGLIFNEGEEWLFRRRMVLPAFRTATSESICAISVEETREMLREWESSAQAGEPVVVLQQTQRLTLSIIGRALLSTRIDREAADAFGSSVKESLRAIRDRNIRPVVLPPWVPTKANRRIHAVRESFESFLEPHIREREELPEGERPDDILSHLVGVRDARTGERLDRVALMDETKTLFAAGFETTATGLAWCLYLLGKHPEVAAVWREELDTVLNGAEPDMDSLSRLPWTAAIVHEALRLYPPVPTVARASEEDDVVLGKRVRRGDVIVISIFGVQRNPEEWDAPDEFRPERFLPGRPWNRDAFMPFAVGKHRCIGNVFAHIETMVALAMIGQRFDFSLPEDFTVVEKAFVTLTPDRDIPLTLRRRS
jgi:cytochrome P450